MIRKITTAIALLLNVLSAYTAEFSLDLKTYQHDNAIKPTSLTLALKGSLHFDVDSNSIAVHRKLWTKKDEDYEISLYECSNEKMCCIKIYQAR